MGLTGPSRTVIVEPVESPVPDRMPDPAPEREAPVEPSRRERESEPVPA